ncbi:MAG TPA: methionyl-tRNA formyltransferase [Victivallales bacterium]|nr:methionyl-tRNA formyltransferase [Victivallales bacterium]
MNNKIYFVGSGKIAVPIIDKIYRSEKLDLVGICTQQDRPAGRKKKLLPTPVGGWAEEHNIKIDKPASVNEESFISGLKKLLPDIILVVSYGQILKPVFLAVPKLKCINVHASLLPKYRGASPINAAILNGEKETGISFMEMEKGLDTGGVYYEVKHELSGREKADELEDILGEMASNYVVNVLLDIANGKILPKKQDNLAATYVGKIKKADGQIDWTFSAEKIDKMIRGYYPWPGGYFFINTGKNQKKISINDSKIRDDLTGKPGEIIRANKKEWIISCGDNQSLELKNVIPEGKKSMSGSDFLRGVNISEGTILT